MRIGGEPRLNHAVAEGGRYRMEKPSHHTRPPLWKRLRERLAAHASVRYDAETRCIVHHPDRFHFREVFVDRIARVEAGNRDGVPGVAWETVFLFFHTIDGEMLAVSERDHGFAALVTDLRQMFPRIVEWQLAVPSVKFQLTSVNLWARSVASADDPDE
jgi:hypothetical protein